MNLGLLLSLVFAHHPGTRRRISPPTEPFEAPKYGVTTRIPKDWPLAVREKEDRVFVAIIPQDDPDRPGVAACELGLAPESLEEYRTRIDSNAPSNGAGPTASWPRTGSSRTPGRAAGDDLGIPSQLGRLLARGHGPDRRQSPALQLHPQRRGRPVRHGPPGVRRPGRRHEVLAPEHRGRPAGEGVQPLGPARVQVRPRPARGLEPGARPQRGGAPLRQRPGARRLVGQRPGAGPSAGQGRPEGAGQGASRPAQAGRPELRGPLVQGRRPGQGRTRPSRPWSAPAAARSR